MRIPHGLLLDPSVGKRIAYIFPLCFLLLHVKEEYEDPDASAQISIRDSLIVARRGWLSLRSSNVFLFGNLSLHHNVRLSVPSQDEEMEIQRIFFPEYG